MCGYLSKSLQFSQAIYRRFSAMTGEQLPSSSPSPIQGLYELCNQTFKRSASSPPSTRAIQKVSSLLGTSFDYFFLKDWGNYVFFIWVFWIV